MTTEAGSHIHELIAEAAIPLHGTDSDFDELIDRVGDGRYVLLGEATHGTHEFYQARAEITKRLITEKGFTIVAWEADWPEALRSNRFIQNRSTDRTVADALGSFKRFPVWMWRNRDVVHFVDWLRKHNEHVPGDEPRAGIYGLDLYSLHTSMAAVIAYLEQIDPQAATEARRRYSCFEDFGDDPQAYGMTAGRDRSLSCEQEVIAQLVELQGRAGDFLQRDGKLAEDELFFAEQNALVAKNAEEYYRAMYRGRPNTWNLRDKHMVDTLDNLLVHFERRHEHRKAVIWAHNSHLGDARATQMARQGEWNVGQLVRERHPGEVVLVGFTTHAGSVTAASEWGGMTERKEVLPGMEGSFERLFHECEIGNFMLRFDEHPELHRPLNSGKLERAIGVIYLPETERSSHYFFADLADQFDLVLHYDDSSAVEPLDRTSAWENAELPETFPSGL